MYKSEGTQKTIYTNFDNFFKKLKKNLTKKAFVAKIHVVRLD